MVCIVHIDLPSKLTVNKVFEGEVENGPTVLYGRCVGHKGTEDTGSNRKPSEYEGRVEVHL